MLSFTKVGFMRRQIAASIAIMMGCGIAVSCGGGRSGITNPPTPNVAGAWEFVAVSDSGPVTGIEVALKEGQQLVNGNFQPDGQITATSTQIAFVNLHTASQNLNATGFGGSCAATAAPTNGLGPGSVTAPNAPVSFTFSENGNVFNVTGTLSGDGLSVLDGTYTPQTGNACVTDTGGTITGMIVSKLAGTYAGKMCPLGSTSCQSPQTDFTDSVTATLSENSSATLTVNFAFTAGPDQGTPLTMTGPVTGNAFAISGVFQGQQLTFYGYFESVGNTASLYFQNASSDAQPFYIATLPVQINP